MNQPPLKSELTEPFEVARRVWSDPTSMLMVFVGSAAEFPLNPSVDWLFYTGRLPSDPLARFLSTVEYLRRLIVADDKTRKMEAAKLKELHHVLERKRGDSIPPESYRDVLCMNMIYSIRSVPIVTGKELTRAEKDSIVRDLSTVGDQMGIPHLPRSFDELCQQRKARLEIWVRNDFTDQLVGSYRKAIGFFTYKILITAFPLLVEAEIMERLRLQKSWLTEPMRWTMTLACRTGLIRPLYWLLLPRKIKATVLNWSQATTVRDSR